MKYTCYFDGACEPKNPGGNMGLGAVVLNDKKERVGMFSDFIPANPENSNNVAEYKAFGWLVAALSDRVEKTDTVEIFGDSKLVVNQMNGFWKIKQGRYVEYAQGYLPIFQRLKTQCKVYLKWIPREQNQLADDLSKAHLIANNVAIADRVKKPKKEFKPKSKKKFGK
jgi:ribonuclease HI